MTALLSDDETQAVFPLYICLARLAPKDEDEDAEVGIVHLMLN